MKEDLKKQNNIIIDFFEEVLPKLSEEKAEIAFESLSDAFSEQSDELSSYTFLELKALITELENVRVRDNQTWLRLLRLIFGADLHFYIEEFYVRTTDE